MENKFTVKIWRKLNKPKPGICSHYKRSAKNIENFC